MGAHQPVQSTFAGVCHEERCVEVCHPQQLQVEGEKHERVPGDVAHDALKHHMRMNVSL